MIRDSKQSSRMTMIGVAAAKGGVGQSLIALHWARTLGASGKRVLLLEAGAGDLPLLAGVAPPAFADAVAGGRCPAADAISACAPGVDLLAAPEQWRFAGDGFSHVHGRLVEAIEPGPWEVVVVDLGKTPCLRGQALWERCDSIGLVTTADVAAVSRGYALLREIITHYPDRAIGLVFNRLANATDAKTYARKFELLTSRFLGQSFPVYGTVTEGSTGAIQAAVLRFASKPPSRGGRRFRAAGPRDRAVSLNTTASLTDNREEAGVHP